MRLARPRPGSPLSATQPRTRLPKIRRETETRDGFPLSVLRPLLPLLSEGGIVLPQEFAVARHELLSVVEVHLLPQPVGQVAPHVPVQVRELVVLALRRGLAEPVAAGVARGLAARLLWFPCPGHRLSVPYLPLGHRPARVHWRISARPALPARPAIRFAAAG